MSATTTHEHGPFEVIFGEGNQVRSTLRCSCGQQCSSAVKTSIVEANEEAYAVWRDHRDEESRGR